MHHKSWTTHIPWDVLIGSCGSLMGFLAVSSIQPTLPLAIELIATHSPPPNSCVGLRSGLLLLLLLLLLMLMTVMVIKSDCSAAVDFWTTTSTARFVLVSRLSVFLLWMGGRWMIHSIMPHDCFTHSITCPTIVRMPRCGLQPTFDSLPYWLALVHGQPCRRPNTHAYGLFCCYCSLFRTTTSRNCTRTLPPPQQQ